MIEKIDKDGKWEVTALEKCNVEILVEPSQLYKDTHKKIERKKPIDLEKLVNKMIEKGVIANKEEVI